ncbi:MAG: hypothetical protein KF709_06480 [Gemmatimonadaceae bacterium]|nr:hypothetical protein [Gemmatimonadaceae bacterium]
MEASSADAAAAAPPRPVASQQAEQALRRAELLRAIGQNEPAKEILLHTGKVAAFSAAMLSFGLPFAGVAMTGWDVVRSTLAIVAVTLVMRRNRGGKASALLQNNSMREPPLTSAEFLRRIEAYRASIAPYARRSTFGIASTLVATLGALGLGEVYAWPDAAYFCLLVGFWGGFLVSMQYLRSKESEVGRSTGAHCERCDAAWLGSSNPNRLAKLIEDVQRCPHCGMRLTEDA